MKEKKLTTKHILYAGMFAALLAALSQVAIPLPSGVPVTLQTFTVALTGVVLGWKLGSAAVIVYILLGLIGVPVFSHFTAGPGILFGMSGGFIFGFVFLAALCGFSAQPGNKGLRIVLGTAGLVICHVLGVLQFSLVTGTPAAASFFYVSAPYVLKDVISVVVAYIAGRQVQIRLKQANLYVGA